MTDVLDEDMSCEVTAMKTCSVRKLMSLMLCFWGNCVDSGVMAAGGRGGGGCTMWKIHTAIYASGLSINPIYASHAQASPNLFGSLSFNFSAWLLKLTA
jgi:hypothetical protein